jgi:hypothetical protein
MTTRYTAPDASVAAALAVLGTDADAYGPTLNAAVSPADVETIGTALAEALRGYRVEAVAAWSTRDEAVLAHIVARELKATVRYADELGGLVSLQPEILPGSRTALIATAWQQPLRISALRAVAGVQQAELVAIAAVIATPALGSVKDLPTVHLAAEANAA